MMVRYPVKFLPQRRNAIWGTEIWLVSGHSVMPSVVANGEYAGWTLPELVEAFGAELMGDRVPDAERFPLLIKVIEANDRLSLQVHPSEKTRHLCGGDPKTEMWYALDCAPGACIFAGLKAGVDRDALVRSFHDGSTEDALVRFEAKRGEVLFIPGGLVHAIGGGCRLYEVQQTSDTTWRLHDWNRIDRKTGLPRTLNEKEGLAAINWTLPPPTLLHADSASGKKGRPLVACDCFQFSCLKLSAPTVLYGSEESFIILFASKGDSRLIYGDDAAQIPLAEGECALIPAGLDVALHPSGTATILQSSL